MDIHAQNTRPSVGLFVGAGVAAGVGSIALLWLIIVEQNTKAGDFVLKPEPCRVTTNANQGTTDFLRNLGGAETSTLPDEYSRNAHIHLPPNFSAFDSVTQAVELAARQNVRVLGASNYYDYHVYRAFAREAQRRGIFPLFGLEIITFDPELAQAQIKVNDPGNPGKMYVCGKAITRFDPMNSEAERLLAAIRDNDSARMAQVIEALNTVFAQARVNADLTESGIKAAVSQACKCPIAWVYLQERHVARAFADVVLDRVTDEERASILTRLFGTASKNPQSAAVVQNEIRAHLMKAGRPAYVAETFVDLDHAYRLICALGGIPCYPVLADGANPICAYEADPASLVTELQKRDVFCAEFIPVRNAPDVLTRYVRTLRDAGFVITAGTEHNTPDLIPLTPTCLNGELIPAEADAIFREGVCVLAAHQFEVANGRPGFVDSGGQLCPGFTSNDDRIRAFARIGADVLARFAQTHPFTQTGAA